MTELEKQLCDALKHISSAIERQLELIAERAPGQFLDKRPVVQALGSHARRANAAIAAAEATSLQPTVAVVPDFPGRLSIADLDYAQKLKPESWSDEHFETWQLLQVASRNVTRLHIYARQLRSMLEAAPPATVKDSLIVQQAPAGFRPDQFFAYSHEIGFELLNTAEDARSFAQQEIDEYRDNAAEGWDEAVENVRWGVVLGKAEQIPITDHDGNTTDSSGDRFVDYVLSDCAPAQVEQQETEGNAVELSDDEICTMAKSYRRVECHVPVYAFNRRELVAFARRVVATQLPPEPAITAEHIVEQIAQQWDECEYEGSCGNIDIGAAIRAAARLADGPQEGGAT